MMNQTHAHLTISGGLKSTKSHFTRPRLTLQTKLDQMRLILAPIYLLPNGPPHDDYPQTLLHYWLLTESQLDSLAQYYHQLSPANPWHNQYPACMNWDPNFLAKPDPLMSADEMKSLLSTEERLGIKRRMLGKFIGLRGCETPLVEVERKLKFLDETMQRTLRRKRRLAERKWPFN